MTTTIKDGLLYTKHDEWLLIEGDTATIGISDYAQDALSDIVYLELPDIGDTFEAEEEFGTVESVKAASELFMPIDAEITAINEELLDTPETVNTDPFGNAWMVKVKITNPSQLDGLMDATAYRVYCDER